MWKYSIYIDLNVDDDFRISVLRSTLFYNIYWVRIQDGEEYKVSLIEKEHMNDKLLSKYIEPECHW